MNMNAIKYRLKKKENIAHADWYYGAKLDKLMAGVARPSDVTYRWNKVRIARGIK